VIRDATCWKIVNHEMDSVRIDDGDKIYSPDERHLARAETG
jgi:hypothetical protein